LIQSHVYQSIFYQSIFYQSRDRKGVGHRPPSKTILKHRDEDILPME